MGLFTTVDAEFSCRRCERTFVGDVQFKTGHEQDLPTYREGDRVTDVPAGTYEGLVDAYCGQCTRRWRNDERLSHFKALADAVSSGTLIVRRGFILRDAAGLPVPDEADDFTIRDLDSDPVEPSELESIGPTAGEPGAWPNFAARLSDANLVLFEAGQRIHPTRRISNTDWWSRHNARVDTLMKKLGWPLGSDPFVEPNVVVTTTVTIERNGIG